MKKSTINLFSIMFLLVATTMFSQGKIKGTVSDSELNGALPGVNVLVKGSTTGASTDIDGKFLLNTTATSGQVVISYVGFQSQTVSFSVKKGETVDLGSIKLVSNSSQLEEVVVKSNLIDIAKDRKTPVAVSTIRASEIQQKLGNQEFPEILKNTPSVYASKAGGGFGDSRVTIRGFSQENIAVMINGVPVNDMENSRVFWSNWAGLSDVTSAMQVQRGLGSSKLAISSVGGTINVITKTSDMKEGGSVSVGTANNDYLKTQTSYSTGKMKNGFSASFLLSQTKGDGYVNGTKFEGANYFLALGYEINKKHDLQFTFTGAPQWHNQRGTAVTVADYIKYGQDGEPNIKYNADWGMLNGKEYNFRTNYYHKPVMSLNWDYKISDKTKLSTVVYGSWGRGGGTGGAGRIRGLSYIAPNFRNADGTINVDNIYSWNNGQSTTIPGLTPSTATRALDGGKYISSTATANNLTNGISKISSINSHNWYGGVASLNTKINDKLVLDFGVDLRTYRGIHYQNVSDLVGGYYFKDVTSIPVNGVYSNGNGNDPNRILTQVYESTPSINPFFNVDHQQKVSYNNDGNVNWLGAFTQLEYTTDKLTAYFQAAISQQGFKRVDYFKYLEANPLSSTPYENILGGNVKGGLNYNINKNHNVFVNAGYYSKQPFFNAVYPNNASVVNGNLVNEKITGFEAGYGFRSAKFNANVNLYNTTWKDRYQRSNDVAADNIGGYYDFSGITEVHSGIEVDMNAKVTDKFKVNGMFSLGSWEYKGNSISNRYDVTNNPISGGTATTLYLDKVKVGNSAQLTASLGGAYEVFKRVSLDATYIYTDKLYANISPANFSSEINKGSLELPAFGLVDAGFSYKLLVGKDKADSVNFRLNVNNLLDKTFIAESSTNNHAKTREDFTTDALYQTYVDTKLYNGVDTSNSVYFGFGRTWNFGISYNF
ncbi:TonB-dependent receptor [Flavobacterium sp.]|jgi:outer membrane cobalamin receptor|uniref:TonB-dependent receptor n=1 Tax=Flavobacterium sp. TaxID=239 RepID=UPI0037BE6340